MDVGAHSSASCATKAESVPVSARGVVLRNRLTSAGGGRLDPGLMGQVHFIAVRLEEYAARAPRPPLALPQVLFPYLEAL